MAIQDLTEPENKFIETHCNKDQCPRFKDCQKWFYHNLPECMRLHGLKFIPANPSFEVR